MPDLYSEPPTVYRAKHASLRLRDISEGTKKVERAHHFGKRADVVCQKISKLVGAY